jgi:hypothetical protein
MRAIVFKSYPLRLNYYSYNVWKIQNVKIQMYKQNKKDRLKKVMDEINESDRKSSQIGMIKYRTFYSEIMTVPNLITLSRIMISPYLGWLIYTVYLSVI